MKSELPDADGGMMPAAALEPPGRDNTAKMEYRSPLDMPFNDNLRDWWMAFAPVSAIYGNKASIRDAVLTDFTTIFQRFSGPQRFLANMLPDATTRAAFAAKLDTDYPPGNRTNWDRTEDIYNLAKDKTISITPGDLSFAEASSVKASTFTRVAMQLLDEFLLNGFVTENDPLRIWTPVDTTAGAPFQLYYVKGAARSNTLLALLLALYLLDSPPLRCCPRLHASLQKIHVIAPLVQPSHETVALKNAQLAQRGAIRKPLGVFSWVALIRKLGTNINAKELLAKWNEQYATRDFKLVGNKRMAIFNLLDAPTEGVGAILDQIARLGIEHAAANEEAMADKKLFPGHTWKQFQLTNWTKMLKVTPESFNLMCKMMAARIVRSRVACVIKHCFMKRERERAREVALIEGRVARSVLRGSRCVLQKHVRSHSTT